MVDFASTGVQGQAAPPQVSLSAISLVKRFGEEYRTYQQNVPQWIPRLTPWKGGLEGQP